MEKLKVTKREMKNRYNRIVKIGYCDAQYLLTYENPIAYSTRSEGWACDYYDIDGILISTGYTPLDDKNMKHDFNLLQEYEQKARVIVLGQEVHEEQREKVTQLLKQFINEITL